MKGEQIFYGDEGVDQVIKSGNKAFGIDGFVSIANDTNALIVDTRSAPDFAKGFIPDSINIGIYGSFVIWFAIIIPDIKQPILFIADEWNTQKVLTQLTRAGYDNVIGYLEGGIDTWEKAGKAVNVIPAVSVNEFSEAIMEKATLQILDVRKRSEYLTGHIVNVINAPLDNINESMLQVNKDSTTYLHCADGYRSMIFASILKARGFNNLVVVNGSFKAIKETAKFNITSFVCPTSRL